MKAVFIDGTRVSLGALLGVGGEAEVYAAEPGLAIKIWKTPEHPDFDGLVEAQEIARTRIEHHRRVPFVARGPLPPEVVVPIASCLDDQKQLVGYAMRRVDSAEPLESLADPAVRKLRSTNEVMAIFLRLHGLVEAVHAAQHLIGDFNDLNVLVKGTMPYLIDVDSWSSGLVTYTERFYDPELVWTASRGAPSLPQPRSDWYSFAALLFQSLLCVGPWAGVAPGKTLRQRIDRRLWVLDPNVRYPRAAIDPRSLSDALRTELQSVLCGTQRTFDRALLSAAFTRCTRCGLEHAHRSCPACTVVVPILSVRGKVRSIAQFSTDGVIVHAVLDGNELRIVHHVGGAYRDQDGVLVRRGPLDSRRHWAWQGSRALTDEDVSEGTFVANARHRYWCADGQLLRDGALGPERIGDVLAGRTRLFVGEHFGLGLYRAGARTVAFLFDAERCGINDSLALPQLPGQLVGVRAYFGQERVWLLLAHVFGGVTEHHALVFDRAGMLTASTREPACTSSWLTLLSGKVAAGKALLCATDDGLARVEAERGALVVTREFPDTAPFLDASCELLAGPAGLYVVSSRRVAALSID